MIRSWRMQALACVVVAVLAGCQSHAIDVVKIVAGSLEQQEGFKAFPYHDTRGVPTIGYGTSLANGITEAEGALLLRERLGAARDQLAASWPPYRAMPADVRAALLDMAYQLGVHGVLEFRVMLEALDAGDYQAAAHAALNSAWARETPARAESVAQVFRTLGRHP